MAYRIAAASHVDLTDLIEKGRLESPYGEYEVQLDEIKKAATFFALYDDVTPIGFLAAVINDQGPILKGTKVATELFWYVDPEHRGNNVSLSLISHYEQWARDNGCRLASICNMRNQYMERLGHLYKRLGYYKAEETYLKDLA